jgi:hypothetical protein
LLANTTKVALTLISSLAGLEGDDFATHAGLSRKEDRLENGGTASVDGEGARIGCKWQDGVV